MNEKQQRIKISSKVIAVIMKIGYIACIVGMSICAAGLLFIAVTGKTETVFGKVRILAFEGANLTVPAAISTCVTPLVASAFLFVIFLLTYRMFHEISETGTPFCPRYVRSIKTIGILVAVMTVVGNAVNSVFVEYGNIEGIGMFDDSTGVIFGVLIFCLAYIFDYGCSLQQQSDETL